MIEKNVRSRNSFSPLQVATGAVVTAALTFSLLATAFARPQTGARTALDGSVRYACTNVCFDRYNTCIGQGTLPATCMTRLQYCVAYCTGGGGTPNIAAPTDNAAPTE